MGKWLVAMLAVNAVVTGALCVWILRRLGNPILAIRRALNEIGDGNLEVRLRTGDAREFNELTVALNRALEEVQGRIRDGARADARARRARGSAAAGRRDALREALVELPRRARAGSTGTRRAGPAVTRPRRRTPTPAACGATVTPTDRPGRAGAGSDAGESDADEFDADEFDA